MSKSDTSYYHKEIINKLIPYAANDECIVLLVCDMGFGVGDKFKSLLPDRYINVGIMN